MKKGAEFLAVASVVAIFGSVLVASQPSSFATMENAATINISIGETLSLKINNSEEPITTNISMDNASLDENSTHVINVATNNPKGYTLVVIDSDTDNSLKRTEGSFIPATSSTSLDKDTAGWGIRIKTPDASDFDSEYKAVPISTEDALKLYKNDGTNVESGTFNEDTTVKIGVATGFVPAGTYTDTIVYKVTGNV